MMVKIFAKKKLSVEFVWMNLVKVVTPLGWNAAAKAILPWPTKNVL